MASRPAPPCPWHCFPCATPLSPTSPSSTLLRLWTAADEVASAKGVQVQLSSHVALRPGAGVWAEGAGNGANLPHGGSDGVCNTCPAKGTGSPGYGSRFSLLSDDTMMQVSNKSTHRNVTSREFNNDRNLDDYNFYDSKEEPS